MKTDYAFRRGGVLPSVRRLDYSHDVPPLGCNADAMKLFVGNIPKTYTADSLRPLFEAIGTVVELVVVRDKLTDESKGSAFVWYQTRGEAERAIAELHLRRVLQDPTGEQDRPLVVRRANPKVPPALLAPMNMAPAPTFAETDLPAHLQGASFLPHQRTSLDSGMHLGPNTNSQMSQMQMMDQFSSLGLNSAAPLSAGMPLPENDLLGRFAAKSAGFNAFLDQSSHPLLGQTAPPMFPSLSSMSSGNPTSNRNNDLSSILQSTLSCALQQTPANATPGTGSMGFGQMTLALHVSRQHGALVATNLHHIQGSTGAMVQLTPGSGDSYVLMLSGHDSQLDAAKTLVHDLVGQNPTV